jgi:hypothetical protein
MNTRFTLVSILLLGASLGCGADDDSANDGKVANGGYGDTTGGGAGSSTDGSCFPPCFASQVAACTPTGTCTTTQTGSASAECYDNGVKFCSPGAPPVSVVVTKADGKTKCVTMDVTIDEASHGGTATYKDASGKTFATATFTTDPVVKLTCGGKTYDVDRSKPGCAFGSGGIPGACKTGSCSCE